MSNKIFLITGGAGFIGSALIRLIFDKTKHGIVNVDKLTYAGNLKSSDSIQNKNHNFYAFEKANICDKDSIERILFQYEPDAIIHLAAESHVDRSIDSPDEFIHTNIFGTHVLLEQSRAYWMSLNGSKKDGFRFHHVSTDEVYGTLGETGLFKETTAYAPNSPYSASKASSDFIVRSYHHTYGMNVVTTNCSNNYGPKQHDEKLIPVIIRKALAGENIPIYGNGKNIRDWLYVLDHCKGIAMAFHKGVSGNTYNIGGKNERTNIYIAKKICKLLDKKVPLNSGESYTSQISYVTDRAGHDFRYAIDAKKIEKELGWKADENFESGIEITVDWYLKKYKSEII